MELELVAEVPGYTIPESRTFAHRTRLAESWHAFPEEIVWSELEVGGGALTIRVFDGDTGQLDVRRPTKNPLRMARRLATLDLSGKFVFDARYETDTNMGHYVVDTVPRILTARSRLSAELGREVEIQTILRHRPTEMAVQVFRRLGLPVITTEARVVGRIVTVTPTLPMTWERGRVRPGAGPVPLGLLGPLYEDFRSELRAESGDGPERVFISRKSSRRLENEREITDLLAARGFERFYFETDERPVREQWRIVAGAREVVAIHGAGLTPLAFNPQGLDRAPGDPGGLRVIELYGAGYFVDFNRRLAAVVNAHWCGVRGRITPRIVRDLDERGGRRIHQASAFRIDPESLEMALSYSAAACPVAEERGACP